MSYLFFGPGGLNLDLKTENITQGNREEVRSQMRMRWGSPGLKLAEMWLWSKTLDVKGLSSSRCWLPKQYQWFVWLRVSSWFFVLDEATTSLDLTPVSSGFILVLRYLRGALFFRSSFPPSDSSCPHPSSKHRDEMQSSWRVWVCAFLSCVQVNHKRHTLHLS